MRNAKFCNFEILAVKRFGAAILWIGWKNDQKVQIEVNAYVAPKIEMQIEIY